MIRRVSHTLNNATEFKKSKLNDFFEEYTRLVNAFIKLYWMNRLPKTAKANSEVYNQIDSWVATLSFDPTLLESSTQEDRGRVGGFDYCRLH